MRRHLGKAANGVDLWFREDQATGEVTIEETSDAEPVVQSAKEARDISNGWTPSRELLLMAQIPPTFITKWSREDGVNYLQLPKDEFWKRCKRKIAEQGLDDFYVNKGRTAFRTGYQGAQNKRRFSLGRTNPAPALIV